MSKFKVLILFIVNLLITLTQNQSILSQNCVEHQLPTKFGVLTTTYIRAGSTKMFKDYLKRYAESDCDAYDNIYIIWNNDESPQEMGVLTNKDKWKKNVYFMPTVQNSLDFKYIVPPWAPEKIFFSMDDDFDIPCQTLKTGFQAWQNSSFGQIGPLTAFYGRSFVFEPQTQSFTYIDQVKLNKKWNYYHFGLTGISFISRHFLQLYYADIFQLKEMRKHVIEKFNCEDLLLNFMVSYLYPEVSPKYIELPFKSLGITGVSATKKHKEYRAQCISKFSDIIGYNPLRYVQAKTNASLMQKKTDLQQSCMINLKQQHYEKTFISNRAYYLYIKRIAGVDNDFTRDENIRLLEAKQNIVSFMEKRKQQIEKQNASKKNVKIRSIKNHERKMFEDDEMMMHFGSKKQIEKFNGKFPEPKALKIQTIETVKDSSAQIHVDQNPSIISHEKPEKQSTTQQKSVSQDTFGFESFISSISLIKVDELAFYLAIFTIIVVAIFGIKRFLFTKASSYQNVSVPHETFIQ